MPSDMLYGNKYKYILSGIDVSSKYKVAKPMRMKQGKEVANIIADIYKVGPLIYPKVFQFDNGSEFKAKVTKMLEKRRVKIQCTMTKYKHTHMAFIEALNKLLPENLFKVQDAQELNDPEKVSSTWVKHLYGLIENEFYCHLLPLSEEQDDQRKRATDRIWSEKTYRLNEVMLSPSNRVMYYSADSVERAFFKEALMLIPENTKLIPDFVPKW